MIKKIKTHITNIACSHMTWYMANVLMLLKDTCLPPANPLTDTIMAAASTIAIIGWMLTCEKRSNPWF